MLESSYPVLRILRVLSFTLVIPFFFLSCERRPIETDPIKELNGILGKNSTVLSSINSVKISIRGDRTYNVKISAPLNRSEIDSGDESIYLPLIIAGEPLIIPAGSYTTIDSVCPLCDGSDPDRIVSIPSEIISVAAKSGNYYYIAAILQSEIDSVLSETNSLLIEFKAFSESPNSKINIPLGNSIQQTKFEIDVDSFYNLAKPKIFLANNEDAEMIEYPKEYISRKTYGYSGPFQPNTLADLDLSVTSKLMTGGIPGNSVILIIFFAALVGIFTLGYLSRKKSLVKIDYLKNRYLNLILEAFHKEEKINPDPIEKLKALEFYRREQDKKRIRKWLLPVVLWLVLLIIYLIISIPGWSQTTNVSHTSIINDLYVDLTLNFNEKDNLELSTSFKYLYCSSRPKKNSQDSMYIYFSGTNSKIDLGKTYYDPKECECRWMNYVDRTGVCIINKYPKLVRQTFLDIITNPETNRDEVKSNVKFNDEGKYSILDLSFSKYQIKKAGFKKRRFLGFKFHPFPYDKDSILIPITFEKFAILNQIKINKVAQFSGKVSINLPDMSATEGFDDFTISSKNPVQLGAGQPVLITMILERSVTSRILLPVLAGLIVITSFLLYKWPRKLWTKLLAGLFTQGVLIAIYSIAVKDSFKGIPHFFDFQDVINWYDVIFGIGVLITTIVAIISGKKPAKDSQY